MEVTYQLIPVKMPHQCLKRVIQLDIVNKSKKILKEKKEVIQLLLLKETTASNNQTTKRRIPFLTF